jgi:hypothetical protein
LQLRELSKLPPEVSFPDVISSSDVLRLPALMKVGEKEKMGQEYLAGEMRKKMFISYGALTT